MDGFNIKQDSATGEQILRCGLSLVRHTPATDLLRFSHSSVRAFLLDPPAETGRSEPFADLEIVQICCLRYLMQPKYESMLRKAQPGQVSLANGNADKLSHSQVLVFTLRY
ncbi:hypothetical protein NW766_012697 [Fusarium irregulare]|uniref:Uncharacterized protein n=1 Tax=Fusarium irregulare TaxID=2494466 RepID=A0A9W8U424_9HYPO|nr:hypothetical protein NW766_012697 [Fusarium irregulare]